MTAFAMTFIINAVANSMTATGAFEVLLNGRFNPSIHISTGNTRMRGSPFHSWGVVFPFQLQTKWCSVSSR